ncbi:SGNH/GDSL hydrolase family protein [Campylobacter coli]|nr:SGNH/GDSL hydrolase family protein [Campylobacter coli]EAV9628498.1 SGNH/GDSL hydrolase family protein [Campylobacter coli]ECZ1568369.1 SGNH/GDSL hydrolase family protein [Campylobacter coli]EFO9030217.1 SGNH/GDSL hydrolase family protein [Campylobacter coli]
MKKIVLLGGSNSILSDGIPKAMKANKDINFINLALSGSASLQNVYEIIRKKDEIEHADLLICESNLNDKREDFHQRNLKQIIRDIVILYEQLNMLNVKRILILLLPYDHVQCKNSKIIDNVHRKLCQDYNFNVVDMASFFHVIGVHDFYMNLKDSAHQLPSILYQLGVSILNNLQLLSIHKYNNATTGNVFTFYTPKEISDSKIEINNSLVQETAYKVSIKDIKENFSNQEDRYLIGAHYLHVTASTKLSIYKSLKEIFLHSESDFSELSKWLDRFRYLTSLLFCDKSYLYGITEKVNKLLSEDLMLDKSIYFRKFDCLIPDVLLFKSIIEDYNKVNLSQNPSDEIFYNVNNQIIFGAVNRVKHHLAYKLGQVMVYYSKTIKGRLLMPIILSCVMVNHKFTRKFNDKLPPLSEYIDYEQGMKIKQHLTYQLGEALIYAHKNWYKGGYVRLFFHIRKIKSRKGKLQ